MEEKVINAICSQPELCDTYRSVKDKSWSKNCIASTFRSKLLPTAGTCAGISVNTKIRAIYASSLEPDASSEEENHDVHVLLLSSSLTPSFNVLIHQRLILNSNESAHTDKESKLSHWCVVNKLALNIIREMKKFMTFPRQGRNLKMLLTASSSEELSRFHVLTNPVGNLRNSSLHCFLNVILFIFNLRAV